jgi:hypothetical protein
MSDRVDRVRGAFHESGHAVISLALGVPVSLVTIVPSGEYAARVEHPQPEAGIAYAPLTRAMEARVGVMKFVLVEAGRIAEEIAFGEADLLGCALDCADAIAAVERTDNAMGTESWQLQGWATRAAETYLREHWHLVTGLALVLLDELTLTGARVGEVVGDVPRFDTTSIERGVQHWAGVMAARAR